MVEHKIEAPASRVTDKRNPLKETVTIEEETSTGLKAPKAKFMELSRYRSKFGEPAPELVKSNVYNGVTVQGVDIIDEEERVCICPKDIEKDNC